MKKSLGQHFLINRQAVKKIISALDLQPNNTVIEIGPGKGALTFPLAEECQKIGCKLIAIEKDQNLFQKLVNNNQKIRIINGDALKILPLPITDYKIVGNIPYYITGKLLRILSELKEKPKITVLMLQKEVAERIAAQPPRMNLLSAAVQFWTEPKILFSLKPKDFNPPPKVNSAVIQLTTKQQTTIDGNEKQGTENYYKLIRIIFKQPRKTILNNLKNGLKLPVSDLENSLKTAKIDPSYRPQNLSLKQLLTIKIVSSFLKDI